VYLQPIRRTLLAAVLLLSLLGSNIDLASAQTPAAPLLWFRADTGVIATPRGRISRWKDLSGNGYDAVQSTDSLQPSAVFNATLDRRVVRFDGERSYMTLPSVFPVHTSYTLTVVLHINNFLLNNNILSGNQYAHYFGATPTPTMLHNGDFTKRAVSTLSVSGALTVITYSYDDSTKLASISIDGFPAGVTQVDANSDPAIYLGAYQGNALLAGDITELTLYARALTPNQQHAYEASLIARYAIAIPGSYDPPTAGMKWWLRADSGIMLQGNGISRWMDVSGNGYDAWQDSLVAQPTFVPHAQLTVPAVHFDGEYAFMRAPAIFPAHADYTLTFVVRINGFDRNNSIISGTTYAHLFGFTSFLNVLHTNGLSYATSTIGVSPTDFAILTVRYVESTKRASIFVNGQFADSAYVGTTYDSTLYLGSPQEWQSIFGDLAEVLLYPTALSDASRDRTETYLFHKYGIVVPQPPPKPDSTFSRIPKTLQLYARDHSDSALVTISGALRTPGFDSVYVTIERNDQAYARIAEPLEYRNSVAEFSLALRIHAELSEYRVTVGAIAGTRDSVLTVRDSIVCGDAFMINGQSNVIYPGLYDQHEFGRTFGLVFSHNASDTAWYIAHANVSERAPIVGAWGMYLEDRLINTLHVPVCIMNGGVAGSPIQLHQRDSSDPSNLATIYGSLRYRIEHAELANAIKAIFWYQGEANGAPEYYPNFKPLHDSWRLDYPNAKIYEMQIRPACGGETAALRELQRTIPDSLPDVGGVSLMGVVDFGGCHFFYPGYDTIASQLLRRIMHDVYSSPDSVDLVGPNIKAAFYTDSSYTRLALVFDNARSGLLATPDTTLDAAMQTLSHAFFCDDSVYLASHVECKGDTAYLTLAAPYHASTISYVPQYYYNSDYGYDALYEGPWLLNQHGPGAFSFYRFPIGRTTHTGDVRDYSANRTAYFMPNPFHSTSTLHLTLDKAQTVSVELYDELGQLVLKKEYVRDAGTMDITIDRKGLTRGALYCKVHMNGTQQVYPLAVE